jgi:endoglucanase
MLRIIITAVLLVQSAALAAAQPAAPAPQAGAQPVATPAAATPTATAPTAAALAATAPSRQLKLDARAIPLGGALKDGAGWRAFKTRFVTQSGRVIDTANELISHSEGQGYGMLLAVAANDRAAFDQIWGWTRANLMVRDDQLAAWRWQPNHRPAIADMNNATDGDVLIAWALAEAAELWTELAYRAAARRIAVEVSRKLVMFKTAKGHLLMPGIHGFSVQERPKDGPVINLSYYVFPALQRLNLVAPEVDWGGLSQTGLDLVMDARFGPAKLPTEWMSMKDGIAKPADGFPADFSYNAIRIPLYMAWAGVGGWEHYDTFHAWATRSGRLATIDTVAGKDSAPLTEAGYAGITSLLACALDEKAVPPASRQHRDGEHYYPSIIHLLAMTALSMRYPQCLAG